MKAEAEFVHALGQDGRGKIEEEDAPMEGAP